MKSITRIRNVRVKFIIKIRYSIPADDVLEKNLSSKLCFFLQGKDQERISWSVFNTKIWKFISLSQKKKQPSAVGMSQDLGFCLLFFDCTVELGLFFRMLLDYMRKLSNGLCLLFFFCLLFSWTYIYILRHCETNLAQFLTLNKITVDDCITSEVFRSCVYVMTYLKNLVFHYCEYITSHYFGQIMTLSVISFLVANVKEMT